MRRSRIVLLVVLAALVAGIGVWLARDLPRLQTRLLLATSLDADVGLGDLEVRGSGHFVLHDVVIERPAAAPWVRRAELRRVEVEGALGELRAGRVARVTVAGGRLDLEPIRPGEAAGDGAGRGLTVGELVLTDLDVAIHALGETARATLDGELAGELADPRGTLRLASDAMLLAPVVAFVLGEERLRPILERANLALDEPYPDVRATVTVAPGEPVRVTASGGGRLAVGERVRLPFPDLEVVVERAPGSFSPERVTLDASLRGVGTIDAVLVRQDDALALATATVDARRADVLLRAFDLLPAGWEVDGPARLELAHRDGTRYDYTARADLARLALPAGEARFTAREPSLVARGVVRLDGLDQATPIVARLEVPELAAEGMDLPSGLRRLEIDFDGTFDPGDGVDLVGEATVVTASLGTVTADGTLSLAGDGATADLDWRWRDLEVAELTGLAAELGVELPLAEAGGRVTARGHLSGPLADPTVAGFLQAEAVTIRLRTDDGSPMLLTDARLTTSLRLAGGALRLADLRLDGVATGGGLEGQRVAFAGGGTLDLESRELELAASTLELPGLGRVLLAGSWSPEGGFVGEATLPALDDALVEAHLRPALDELVPPGWTYSLDPDAELRLALAGERWTLDGTVALSGVELASDDGSRVVQVADSHWSVAGGGALGDDGDVRVVATTRLPGFVMLWGGLFADYGELAADARVEVVSPPVSSAEDTGRGWGVALELVPDPALRFAARFDAPSDGPLAYEAAMTSSDLTTVFTRFVRRPLADSIEALAGVSAAGAFEATVAGVVGDESRTAAGRLVSRDLELAVAARDLTLRDLDLELPFDLAWDVAAAGEGEGAMAAPRDADGAPSAGSLRFAGLELGEIAVGAIETGLVTVGDRVELERPLELLLLGGRLRLEHLALADLTLPGRELRTGVVVDGLDLGQIAARFGLELAGEVSGNFPDVRADGATFEVEGGGELAVFGGTVAITDISGEEIFSDLPKLQLDAELRDIRLSELTRSFDFGGVSGVARGYVHHLVLFGGTPVRFDGEIETVRVPGVPRRITLKAIENISILGTGGLPAGLGSTFLRIFDRYRYEKIGAHLTLSNDVFLMRGLARRGDKELFMKGQFPPIRIDIVNASPGRTVSFSTMLERLKYAQVGDDGAPQDDEPEDDE